MSRTCSTCQHLKRAEIDHRLAAGEPGEQIDSLSRLAATSEADVIAPVPDPMDLDGLVERILQRFDREPEMKAKIAQALLEMNDERSA